jgi:hypothetical protein
MATAILAAIGSALATRPCQACTLSPQYVQSGPAYIPAGEFGYDYLCLQSPGTICTYYRPYPGSFPNYYVICRWGDYTPVP